jgi:predicted lipoprotein with Yx(FWY)xxD motif
MSRTRALAVVVAAAALTLAACGSDEPATQSGVGPAAATPGTVLTLNSTKQLGTVVVDGNVNTLYRYDQDSANPPTATCLDDCAEDWPPVLVDPAEKPVLEGIDEAAFGTVTRPDGSIQATIGGWPVYRHAESEPGATDGNGVDGAWFAVQPDGSKAAAS